MFQDHCGRVKGAGSTSKPADSSLFAFENHLLPSIKSSLLIELLVLNAADWMGFCAVESHLLLLSVVPLCRTRSLSFFDYGCFHFLLSALFGLNQDQYS